MFVGLATVAVTLAGAVPMVSAAPFAYVSYDNGAGGQVSVIDAANYTVIGTVSVGLFPTGVAVNESGTKAYIANSGATTLSVVETTVSPSGSATVRVSATVELTRVPTAVALNPAGTIAYVTHTDGFVSIVDTNSFAVSAFEALRGNVLKGVAVNNAGTRLYVAGATPDLLRGTVVAVDISAVPPVVTTLVPQADFVPEAIAVNPAGTRVYTVGTLSAGTSFSTGSMAVVDPATLVRTNVALGASLVPVGVVVHPIGNLVYVTNRGLSSVFSVYAPTNTLLAPVNGVRVARSPLGVAVDPTGDRIFVLSDNGTLSVVDPASQTVVKAFALPGSPLTFGAFVGGGRPDNSGQLRQELDAANATVARLTTELAKANGTIDSLTKDLAAAKATVDTLTASLATSDATITALKTSLDQMQKDLAAATERANNYDASMTSLKAELNAANATIKKMQDDLESANLTIASFVRRLVSGQTDANVASVAREAAEKQIALAVTKWGPNDQRVRHAKKEFNDGVSAFRAGHFARATKEFVDAYETAARLRRS